MSTTVQAPPCPKCGGEMWDETKSRYYKAGKPEWKCKDKNCGGVRYASAPNGSQKPAEQEPAEPVKPSVEKLKALLQGYSICYAHAVHLVQKHEIEADVSAMAATMYIQACQRGAI